MKSKLEQLVREAQRLPSVNPETAAAYQTHIPALKKYVDERMKQETSIQDLLGPNSLEVMYENHRHHARLMACIFSIGDYELLVNTVLWVYRRYRAHGVSFDYFPLELKSWMKAVESILSEEQAKKINRIYSWLIDKHETIIELSKVSLDKTPSVPEKWLDTKNAFQSFVLRGDHRSCLSLTESILKKSPDIETFYLYVIQPVMYEIGLLWEKSVISVAHEHLASAIVARIMATVSLKLNIDKERKGKIVVTASPDELHEIGAWMLADVLEQQGWNVRYLGANTPAHSLVTLMKSFRPDILAISVTMPFNIDKVQETIAEVRKEKDLGSVKIMVGGKAINENHSMQAVIEADGFASNLITARELAQKWWQDAG